jgi:hypothetical protein
MSQEMNMNEKPTLERKKTPLRQLDADKTTLPRDDQEPVTFDASKPITDKPQTRTIEITEIECRFPEAGKEKSDEGAFSNKPEMRDAEWTEDQQNKPGVLEGAKDKVRQGVEKAKDLFTSDKPVTTPELTEKPGVLERVKGVFSSPDAKDSEYTDQNKPGVLQGAKNMVLQGVEKAKGVFSSTRFTEPELHPGNGYNWKRVVGEQGQVSWVATNDWSGDSAARGIIAGAKDLVRSGVEKAKGVFSSTPDAKESEYSLEDQKPGILQGAKEKVLQGVEKAKSVFSNPTNEEHPGRGYAWRKTTGDQGQTHWTAFNDWSNDSANQQNKNRFLQGAKEKVLQGKEKVLEGVEKAKGVFSTTKTADEQYPGKGYGYKVEGEQVGTSSS